MNWFVKCLKQYADFKGRARRTEYWMFVLCNLGVGIVAGLLDYLVGLQVFSYLASLALLVPGLAVAVRRLHDVGKSGWYYFLCLIPLIGAIWLLVLFCKDSQPGENEWGANPKEL